MRIKLFTLLIAALFIVAPINCALLKESTTFGSYCTKVVQPLLDLTKDLKQQLDSNTSREKSNTVAICENSVEKLSVMENAFQEKYYKLESQTNSILNKFENFEKLLMKKLNEMEQSFVEINRGKYSNHVAEKLFEQIGTKHYFIENKEEVDWITAGERCQDIGGHLVSLRSRQELANLSKKLTRADYWTDVNDIDIEGRYISATNKHQAFVEWHDGEPNNGGNGGATDDDYDDDSSPEDCVVLKNLSYYAMNDHLCNAKHYYICEKN